MRHTKQKHSKACSDMQIRYFSYNLDNSPQSKNILVTFQKMLKVEISNYYKKYLSKILGRSTGAPPT